MKLSWPERQAGLVSNMLKVACSRYDDHQTGNLPDTLTRDTRSLHPLRTRKGGGGHTSSELLVKYHILPYCLKHVIVVVVTANSLKQR